MANTVNEPLGDGTPEWWSRRIGVYGGRNWHITDPMLRRDQRGKMRQHTLCGKRADREWSPSWRRQNPPVCQDCEKAFTAHTAASSEGPDSTTQGQR